MNAKPVLRALHTVLAALLSIPVFVIASHGASAQTIPGQVPGIVAAGYGRASSPAATAEVQVIVGQDYYGDVGYVEVPPMEEPATGSPVPEGGMTSISEYGPVSPPNLTEEDMAPIVEAVVSAGVPREQIQVITPAFTSMFTGPGGPGGAQLRFSVANPTLDGLTALVNSVSEATVSGGLAVQHVGVHYVGGDCAALQQEARVVAVADARTRAEGLASALDATLGDLTQAADNLYYGSYGPYGAGGCGPASPEDYGSYGPGILPAFDSSAPAEAVAYAQVTLTFTLVKVGSTG